MPQKMKMQKISYTHEEVKKILVEHAMLNDWDYLDEEEDSSERVGSSIDIDIDHDLEELTVDVYLPIHDEPPKCPGAPSKKRDRPRLPARKGEEPNQDEE